MAVMLFVAGGQIAGVPADISTLASGVINVYETLYLTFTPTASGTIDAEIRFYTLDGATTYTATTASKRFSLTMIKNFPPFSNPA
jgi:hypothetical protein